MEEHSKENAKVVKAEETARGDEMALRKVARAVLSIVRRQLEQERQSNALSAKEVDDAEG